MEDVEEDESKEHEGGVEDVLVGFMTGNAAINAVGILDETEYYTNLVELGINDGFLTACGRRINDCDLL